MLRSGAQGSNPEYRFEKVIQIKSSSEKGEAAYVSGFGSTDKQNLCVGNINGLNWERLGRRGRRIEKFTISEHLLGDSKLEVMCQALVA